MGKDLHRLHGSMLVFAFFLLELHQFGQNAIVQVMSGLWISLKQYKGSWDLLPNGKLSFHYSMLQQWVFFKLFIPLFLKFRTIWGNIWLPWDGVSPQATIPAAASRAPPWEKVPTSWEGTAAPRAAVQPPGKRLLVPPKSSGLWCLCAGRVTGPASSTGAGWDGTVPMGSETCPPHCLIFKPIKRGCLFLLASSKDPGASPASEGCLGGWGPSFSNTVISPPMSLCPGSFAIPSPACSTPSHLPLLDRQVADVPLN